MSNTPDSLVQELKLSPAADGLFIGTVQGFPIGLKFISTITPMVILVQIRHPFSTSERPSSSLLHPKIITTLLQDKKLELEFEDKLVWLTFVEADEALARGAVSEALFSFLAELQQKGWQGKTDTCHYCQRNSVNKLTVINSKVAQICQVCLEERLADRSQQPAEATEGLSAIFLFGPLAALVGAAAWCLAWMGYVSLFDFLGTKVIVLPRLVEIIIVGAVALAVGGPTGWVIKQIERRGKTISFAAAMAFGISAVILGEIGWITWMLYRDLHIFSFSIAWHFLPDYYREQDLFFFVVKGLMAIISVIFAAEIATPKKPALKL